MGGNSPFRLALDPDLGSPQCEERGRRKSPVGHFSSPPHLEPGAGPITWPCSIRGQQLAEEGVGEGEEYSPPSLDPLLRWLAS